MSGGLTEVGFVDPHDPTGAEPFPCRCSFMSHSFILVLQLSMHPSPRILFPSELSLTPIALRTNPIYSPLHVPRITFECTLVLHQHFSHSLMRSNSTGILQSGGTFEPLQAARLYFAPYADADDHIKRHHSRCKYSNTYPFIHHASLAELAAASPLPSLVCAALQSTSRSVQATDTSRDAHT